MMAGRTSAENIFSREALEKLRSPERLDTMLPITTPVTWMALAGILVLMIAIILWSIFGSFTVKADGMGLIMDSGGVMNVYHTSSGQIDQVFVAKGDKVRKGELLATLNTAAQQTDALVTRFSVTQAQNDKDAMGRALQYDEKASQLADTNNIYSTADGVIDEVLAEPGLLAEAGKPLFTIRCTEDSSNLTGIFYIPVEKAKRVEPGMTLQLAPNGVDTSQSGSLLGVVRSVSQYPVSQSGVEQGLAGNAFFAQWMLSTAKSPVVEVRFDLVRDKTSESGYLWTSQVGNHKPVTAGSYCTGSIIIDRTPPLQKVFYKFSQWLRNR